MYVPLHPCNINVYEIRKECTYPPLCYDFSQVSWRWCEVGTYICIGICCVIGTHSSNMLTYLPCGGGGTCTHLCTYVCTCMVRMLIMQVWSFRMPLLHMLPSSTCALCTYATTVTVHLFAYSTQCTQHGLVLTGLHRYIIVHTVDCIACALCL